MLIESGADCLIPHRREQVRAQGANGIDYIEVGNDKLTLIVYFFRHAPEYLDSRNIVIEGGARSRELRIIDLRIKAADSGEQDDSLNLRIDRVGDSSAYTLRLVELDDQGQPTGQPLRGLDPRYSYAHFSFVAGEPTDLDCCREQACPAPHLPSSEINYLAKDYASFRQLLLDRLSLTMPGWQERHIPDIGLALVEVLAYVGDYLSYYQDAVATEGYLNTARQRISVRRHARLVDYRMHEGCNSRTWVQVAVAKDVNVPRGARPDLRFITGGTRLGGSSGNTNSPNSGVTFEPVLNTPIQWHRSHNRIPFYTWGDHSCCLPVGATSATLQDRWEQDNSQEQQATSERPDESSAKNQHRAGAKASPSRPMDPKPQVSDRKRQLNLKVGDVLLFEEVIGPHTGQIEDADRSHRHFVRLTKTHQAVDPLYDSPVVEIEWAPEDALSFPLCLSCIGQAPDCAYIRHVSVARGNVVLVDHGIWTDAEELGMVPLRETRQTCTREKYASDIELLPGKFRPSLTQQPLTFSEPFQERTPASQALTQDPRRAVPRIELNSILGLPDGSGPVFSFEDCQNPEGLARKLADSDPKIDWLKKKLSSNISTLLEKFITKKDGPALEQLTKALSTEITRFTQTWTAKQDLLESGPEDRDYVVEMDNEGIAHLRFGDGELGRAPAAGECFFARYSLGNGTSGNVGSEVIDLLHSAFPVKGAAVINPVAAIGGTEAETLDEVRMMAPGNCLKQLERAITADDYASLAERHPKVQRAAAALVWTGTHYEAKVAIDPLGTEDKQPALLEQIQGYLERFRRIGHDLTVIQAQYVPLRVELMVQVLPDYLQGHVKSALLDVFSNRMLGDGTTGFFHPDNLNFGDPVYASRMIAAAQAVKGVESVTLTRLERLFEGANQALENGLLQIGPLEVARLDNDPRFPENGALVLKLRGGR